LLNQGAADPRSNYPEIPDGWPPRRFLAMLTKTFANEELNKRIFIGVFPCGLSYADRQVERDGDYARLAFLGFSDLKLDFDKQCPESTQPKRA
jgi:hypothetical protein